jgi:hypothetical protein
MNLFFTPLLLLLSLSRTNDDRVRAIKQHIITLLLIAALLGVLKLIPHKLHNRESESRMRAREIKKSCVDDIYEWDKRQP